MVAREGSATMAFRSIDRQGDGKENIVDIYGE